MLTRLLPLKIIAGATGIGTASVVLLLQSVGGEAILAELMRATGAGAMATVVVYLVLKGRLDGHTASIAALHEGHKTLGARIGKVDDKLDEIAGDVKFMAGRERGRMDGRGPHHEEEDDR